MYTKKHMLSDNIAPPRIPKNPTTAKNILIIIPNNC